MLYFVYQENQTKQYSSILPVPPLPACSAPLQSVQASSKLAFSFLAIFSQMYKYLINSFREFCTVSSYGDEVAISLVENHHSRFCKQTYIPMKDRCKFIRCLRQRIFFVSDMLHTMISLFTFLVIQKRIYSVASFTSDPDPPELFTIQFRADIWLISSKSSVDYPVLSLNLSTRSRQSVTSHAISCSPIRPR